MNYPTSLLYNTTSDTSLQPAKTAPTQAHTPGQFAGADTEELALQRRIMERLQSHQEGDSNILYKHKLYEDVTSTQSTAGSSLPDYYTKSGQQFNPAMSPMSLNLPPLTHGAQGGTQGGISSQEVGSHMHGSQGTAVGSPGGLVTEKLSPAPQAPVHQQHQQLQQQQRALPQRTGPAPHHESGKGLYIGEHGLQDRPSLDPTRSSTAVAGGTAAGGAVGAGSRTNVPQQSALEPALHGKQAQNVQGASYGQQRSLQDMERQQGIGQQQHGQWQQQHSQWQQRQQYQQHGAYGQQTSLKDLEHEKHMQQPQYVSERSSEQYPHHATVAMAPSKAEHQIQPHLGARSEQVSPFERIRRHTIRVEVRELGLGSFPPGYDLNNFAPYFGIGIGPYLFQENVGMSLGQQLDLGPQNQGIMQQQQSIGQQGIGQQGIGQQGIGQQQHLHGSSLSGYSGTQATGTTSAPTVSRPIAGTPGTTTTSGMTRGPTTTGTTTGVGTHASGSAQGQKQVSLLRSNMEGFCLDPFGYARSRRKPKVVQGQTTTGEPVLIQINPYNGPLARRRFRKAQAQRPVPAQTTVTNYPHLTTGPTVATQSVPQTTVPVVSTQPQQHGSHHEQKHHHHHHLRHRHHDQHHQQQAGLVSMSGHPIVAGDTTALSTNTFDPSAPRPGVFWQMTAPQKWSFRHGNTISFDNNPISFYCDLYNDEITFELYDFNNRVGLKNFFHPSSHQKPLTHGVEPFSRKDTKHTLFPGHHKESHIQEQHGQHLQVAGESSHQPVPLAWGKMSVAPLLGVPGNSVGVYEQYLTLKPYKHANYPPIRRLSELKKGSYQPPQIYASPLKVPEDQRHVWSPQAGGHAVHQRDTRQSDIGSGMGGGIGSGSGMDQEGQWLDKSFCNHHHTSYFDQEMCRAHTDPMMSGSEGGNIPVEAYCLIRITRTDPGQAELTARELNIQPVVIPFGASVVDMPGLTNIIERGKQQQVSQHQHHGQWQQQQQLQQQHVQHGAYGQQTSLQDLEQKQGIGQQSGQRQHIQHLQYGKEHVPQQQQQTLHGMSAQKDEHLVSGTTLEHQDFKKDLPISRSAHEKKVEDPMFYTPSQESAQKTSDIASATSTSGQQTSWTSSQEGDVRGLNIGGTGGAAGAAGVAGVAGVMGGAMGTTMLQSQNLTHRAAPTIAGPISSGQKGLKGSNVFYQDVTNVGPTTFGHQVEIQGNEAVALPAKAPYTDSLMMKDKHGYSMEPGTKVPTSHTAASAGMLPGALGSSYLDEKHRLTGDVPLEQDPTSVQDMERLQQHQKIHGHDSRFATVTDKGLPYSETTVEEKVTPFQPSSTSADRVLYPPVKIAAGKSGPATWDSPVGKIQAAGIEGGRMLSPYAMSDMSDGKYNDPNAWLDRVELAMKYAKSYNIQMAP